MVTRGDLFGPRSSSPPSYQTAPACDLTSEGPHFSDLSSSHPSSVIKDLTATHSRWVFTPEVPPVPGVSYLTKIPHESRSRPFLQLETSSFGYKLPSYMRIESQLPAIIDGLVNDNLNPQQVCTNIAACPWTSFNVQWTSLWTSVVPILCEYVFTNIMLVLSKHLHAHLHTLEFHFLWLLTITFILIRAVLCKSINIV